MKQYRIGYLIFFCVMLFLFFFAEQTYFGWVCLSFFILPVLLYALLRIERREMKLEAEAAERIFRKQEIAVHFFFSAGKRFLASGMLEVRVIVKNVLLNEEREERLLIFPSKAKQTYVMKHLADSCGEQQILFKDVFLYDIFGLCRVPISCPPNLTVMVYPNDPKIDLFMKREHAGSLLGGERTQNRRGNDPSEVFDLKEYHAGDDIRSIHWKLSSKLEHLVLKEASDTLYLNTLVLIDCGYDGELEKSKEALFLAMDIAAGIGRRLSRQGINFCLGFPVEDQLKLHDVIGLESWTEAMTEWMRTPMNSGHGHSLNSFLSNPIEHTFSRMIYITAGECPDALMRLDPGSEVTAVCISDAGNEITSTDRSNCHILNLPLKLEANAEIRISF